MDMGGRLARARLVVAKDSGPRHMADAVGTPTVGIHWCGNLINAGSAFRAWHRPHLSWRLVCPVCGQNTIHQRCQHDASIEVMEFFIPVIFLSGLDRKR